MRWISTLVEKWADRFRLLLTAILFINSLMLAVFSVWFTARFLWRLHQYLIRIWLGSSW